MLYNSQQRINDKLLTRSRLLRNDWQRL